MCPTLASFSSPPLPPRQWYKPSTEGATPTPREQTAATFWAGNMVLFGGHAVSGCVVCTGINVEIQTLHNIVVGTPTFSTFECLGFTLWPSYTSRLAVAPMTSCCWTSPPGSGLSRHWQGPRHHPGRGGNVWEGKCEPGGHPLLAVISAGTGGDRTLAQVQGEVWGGEV